ncbi:PREDICTED: uncharacterized protein LOC108976920 [Bactrocera latifrons]|uniref:Chitin-binding type-2 domain-containing protein n=1 Tax=Bactrocera latifrons TaxID=174628 RepID=A0A0K8UI28_BACLA|nr:PREDICTED: uncharacterized protein LOC108976920 [Bactrocera latifrons]
MWSTFFTKLWISSLLTVCITTSTQAWFLPQGNGAGGFGLNGFGSNGFGFNGFGFNGFGVITTMSEFKCQTTGRFPDPYDCRNFYDCTSSGTYTRHRCGPLKRYSVNQQGCVFAFTVACYNLAVSCSAAGDKGAWPGDASIYYICELSATSGKLVPMLFRCPQGSVFNGAACA